MEKKVVNNPKSERSHVIKANYGKTRKLKKSWPHWQSVFSVKWILQTCSLKGWVDIVQVIGIYNHEFSPTDRIINVHMLVLSVLKALYLSFQRAGIIKH